MATTTTHYGFTKPGVNDYVDISVLNANFDNLDNVIYNNQLSAQAALDDIAPEYDATATYSVGDYVTYNKTLYKCTTAITTAEAFDDTKWTAVKVGGELKSHDTRISTLEAGVDLEKSATNSFDDGIDSYFKKVVSSIVPVQAGSGTPSPINVRAISGFTECAVTDTGKNLFNKATVTANKGVNSEGTIIDSTWCNLSDYIKVTPNQTYYISHGVGSGALIRGCYYDINKNYVAFIPGTGAGDTSGSFTVPYNCAYIRVNINNSQLDVAQVEVGETPTAYEPYKANTATISFGSAGTVYGATVELVSGKLRVVRGYKEFDGSSDEAIALYSGSRFIIAISDYTSPSSALVDNILCNRLETISKNYQGSAAYKISGSDTGAHAIMINVGETTVTDVRTWLSNNPIQVVYPLTTPQEYQLTPAQLRSLVGANRLTSSTGEVTEVEYIKNKTIAWLLDLIRA